MASPISTSTPSISMLSPLEESTPLDTLQLLSLLEKVLQNCLSSTSYENNLPEEIFNLFSKAIHSDLPIDDKLHFLEKAFQSIPEKRWDNIFTYFHLVSSEQQVIDFLAVCPERVKEPFKNVMNEVLQVIEVMKNSDQIKDIPLKDERRLIFLKWFYEHLHELENAHIIMASFSESEHDLEYLECMFEVASYKSTHNDLPRFDANLANIQFKVFQKAPLSDFLMEGLIKITTILKQDSYEAAINFNDHLDKCRYFFRTIFPFMIKKKSNETIPEEKWKALAEVLDRSSLINYLDLSWHSQMMGYILKYIISPEFLKKFCQAAFVSPIKNGKWADNVSNLFYCIPEAHREEVVSLIFENNNDEFTFKVYSSFSWDYGHKKTVLAYLLKKDRNLAITTFANWIDIYLNRNLGENTDHIKASFARNFCKYLVEIADEQLIREIRQKVSPTTPEEQFAVNTLLPVDIDLEEMKEFALQEFKTLFLKPGLSNLERNNRLFLLRKFLPKKQDCAELFQILPEEAWPLIFIHFSIDADKINIKEIGAKTLLKILNNPLVTQIGDTIRSLFEELPNELLFEKFIEITPPEQFMPVVSSIDTNVRMEGLFFPYLQRALNKLNTPTRNKLEFIKDVLIAFSKNPNPRISRSYYQFNYTSLFKEPLLTTEEVAKVGKLLIQQLQAGFLAYIHNHPFESSEIIHSLKSTDFHLAFQLFYRFLNDICACSNPSYEKTLMLRSLCNRYASAEFDVIHLLQNISEENRRLIATYYHSEELFQHGETDFIGMQLFYYFNPANFSELMLRTIKLIISQPDPSIRSLNDIFIALDMQNLENEVLQNENFPSIIKPFLENNFTDIIIAHKSQFLIPIVCKYIENWEDRLIEWVEENLIQRNHENVLDVLQKFYLYSPASLKKINEHDFGAYQQDFAKIQEDLNKSTKNTGNISRFFANPGNFPQHLTRFASNLVRFFKV
ncbi:MAG: hypothetical protein COT84_07305 [Chlamydiae bacterium CG10_big_fil_rev_8_21_14_0_10_35_9]|nr:MAG: hypothetical protein COT84_07305 [Chlamydiae bacterium CG10_big_fil_rev_8_21_14_0_10_35_9]